MKNDTLLGKINMLSKSIESITIARNELNESLDSNKFEDTFEEATYYCDCVLKNMHTLRKHVDSIERFISKKTWPMPSVTDLLYRV